MLSVLPLLLVGSTLAAASPHPPVKHAHYPGWQKIKHLFIFGDSYTTTGFNTSGPQPSVANPLGNPAFPGYTSSNGPNWVDFLTLTYNKTFVETVNLAYGGATVDSALVAPYLPTVLSLKQQVEQEFLPIYSKKPKFFDWKSDDTIFASFIGINDVGNAYGASNSSQIFADVWTEYTSLIEKLYQSGARNFLFLSVPPVDRSPLTVAAGADAQALEAKTIETWNANLTAAVSSLRRRHPDATVFQFDFHGLFGRVLDEPCAYPQTCAYKNTTTYCPSYENGTPSWYTFDPECGIPVDEYFWLNTLHPTFRVHNVTAQKISEMLEGGSQKPGRPFWP